MLILALPWVNFILCSEKSPNINLLALQMWGWVVFQKGDVPGTAVPWAERFWGRQWNSGRSPKSNASPLGEGPRLRADGLFLGIIWTSGVVQGPGGHVRPWPEERPCPLCSGVFLWQSTVVLILNGSVPLYFLTGILTYILLTIFNNSNNSLGQNITDWVA